MFAPICSRQGLTWLCQAVLWLAVMTLVLSSPSCAPWWPKQSRNARWTAEMFYLWSSQRRSTYLSQQHHHSSQQKGINMDISGLEVEGPSLNRGLQWRVCVDSQIQITLEWTCVVPPKTWTSSFFATVSWIVNSKRVSPQHRNIYFRTGANATLRNSVNIPEYCFDLHCVLPMNHRNKMAQISWFIHHKIQFWLVHCCWNHKLFTVILSRSIVHH